MTGSILIVIIRWMPRASAGKVDPELPGPLYPHRLSVCSERSEGEEKSPILGWLGLRPSHPRTRSPLSADVFSGNLLAMLRVVVLVRDVFLRILLKGLLAARGAELGLRAEELLLTCDARRIDYHPT